MTATVYVDVLFFLNAVMDALLLVAVGRLTGARMRTYGLVLGAGLGGLYGVCAVVWETHPALALIGKIIVSAMMVRMPYGKRRLVHHTLVFWGVCFSYGGCILAIAWLGGGGPEDVDLGTLLVAALLCYAIFALVLRRAAAKRKRETASSVRVCHGGTVCEFCAMVDTGNRLHDPVTNAPVVVAELDAVSALFSSEVRYRLAHTEPERLAFLLPALPKAYRFRVIPYRTVGAGHAILLAFRPETLAVNGAEVPGALLAISPRRIAENSPYHALVGILE